MAIDRSSRMDIKHPWALTTLRQKLQGGDQISTGNTLEQANGRSPDKTGIRMDTTAGLDWLSVGPGSPWGLGTMGACEESECHLSATGA